MMKRLAALIAVLAMVAAACMRGTPEDDTDHNCGRHTTTTAPTRSGGQTGGTLAQVIARGSLRCDVSTNAIGFAEPQDDGSFNGFDADSAGQSPRRSLATPPRSSSSGRTAAERFTVAGER